ncbi:MAG: hypothetical protein EOP49_39715, partial [Sphingobacteriales bacterium]
MAPVSEMNSCFIKGKLEKQGLNNASFLFPVGDAGARRWLQLHNATGNLVVEYIRSDPRKVSPDLGAGIAHISSMEYWNISSNGPTASASVELSFDNVNSGGITDLNQLRVASFNGSSWDDAGNSATTGSAGAGGSVKSEVRQWSPAQSTLFSLASSSATQNPLPIKFESFRAFIQGKQVRLEWQAEVTEPGSFHIQRSSDGLNFERISLVEALPGSRFYTYTDHVLTTQPQYYRVSLANDNNTGVASRIVSAALQTPGALPATVYLNQSTLRVQLKNAIDTQYDLQIMDVSGRVLFDGPVRVANGVFSMTLPSHLS